MRYFVLTALVLSQLVVPMQADAEDFRRGDVNVDGVVDISDGIRIINRLFLGADPFPCDDAADANDDGTHDVSDAITVFGFLFLGDQSPPAPFPTCGRDPTEDDLGCSSSNPQACEQGTRC